MEAGFASSIEDARNQDVDMCDQLLLMKEFARVRAKEDHDPKSVTGSEFKWMIDAERYAGLIEE